MVNALFVAINLPINLGIFWIRIMLRARRLETRRCVPDDPTFGDQTFDSELRTIFANEKTSNTKWQYLTI